MIFLLITQIVYNLKHGSVARGSCRLCSLPEPTVSTMHTICTQKKTNNKSAATFQLKTKTIIRLWYKNENWVSLKPGCFQNNVSTYISSIWLSSILLPSIETNPFWFLPFFLFVHSKSNMGSETSSKDLWKEVIAISCFGNIRLGELKPFCNICLHSLYFW